MPPRSVMAGLILGALGFGANWFRYELFFNVDFLFGGIFVMLALLRFGAVAGIGAGVIASIATYFLWNQPWSIVTFSAETAAVAWLHKRRRTDIVTSTVLYWIAAGWLPVWFFFRIILQVPAEGTILILLKQGINAVFNALLAKIVHLGIATLRPSNEKRPGYREYVTTLMLALVLLPALLYIVLDIREKTATHLEDARRRSSHTSRLTQILVDGWVRDNHEHLKALALAVGDPQRTSVPEMQRLAEAFLESARESYARFGIMNRDAVSVAYAPSRDEEGRSTIGLNFSDRPYLAILRNLKMPYVGDVQMSRVMPAHPELPLLVPMVADREFVGYCGGVLNLSPLDTLFREIVGPRNLVISILDRNGNLITSTDARRERMKPMRRAGGEVRPVSDDVSHWLPTPEPGTSMMLRWRHSYYFSEKRVSPSLDWTVVVEAPLLPALTDISNTSIRYLSLMSGLILMMLAVARWISRLQSRPIVALQNLSERVAAHPEQPVSIDWPVSPIREVDALNRNFRNMTERLHQAITELNTLNRELEERVRERTEEIVKSEERLKLALGAARQGWYDLNVQTGEVLVSDEYPKLLGYDPGRFKTDLRTWMEAIHPEDRPAVLAAYRHCLSTGEPGIMEYRRRTWDGGWIWLSSTGRVTEFDAEGKPLRMVGIHSDVSARRQLEESLRESEDRFRSLFEKVHVVALVLDPADGSILDANAAACAFYGWTCEQLLSMKITEINTLSPEQIREEMDAALAEERSYFLFKHRRADGSVRDVEVYSGPVQTRGRTLLYSIIHDITERREAEEHIRRLAQEQEIILKSAPIGIIYIRNRELVWANPHFCEMFGYAPEELRGRKTSLLYTSQESFESIGAEGYAVVATGGIFSKECVMRKKDGSPFWIHLIGRAVDPADVQGGSIWMFQDISSRKQTEEALHELNRTLEERVEAETRLRLEQERLLIQQSKMAAMGEMIGAIAHQWRQPINAVGIIAQDIQDAFEAGRLDRAYLRRAVDETMGQVRFMSKTIDDFRNFFRPDKEQTEFDLKVALAHVLSLIAAQLQNNRISWLVTCKVHGKSFGPGDRIEDCGAMRVRGYENELKQVFLNLIDNAKDAILSRRTGSGLERMEGLIRIEFNLDNGHPMVLVSDNGGGIPENILDRVFEPYFSTKDQGRGIGIGLYMCKMIVERNMKGRITAQNIPDGAEFRIEL